MEDNRQPADIMQKLTVAMMTPDEDVSLPPRSHPGSTVSMLAGLGVGECYTASVKAQEHVPVSEWLSGFSSMKEKLRQSVNQSIRHAKKLNGRVFSMETLVTTSPAGNVYLQVIVTRTE